MGMDCRGDIGFPEAMAGTVTVCIVLMTFSAYVFGMVSGDPQHQATVLWNDFDGFTLVDGEVVWSEPPDLEILANRYGVNGIVVEVEPYVVDCQDTFMWASPGATGSGISYTQMTVLVSDDGRKIPSLIRVVLG